MKLCGSRIGWMEKNKESERAMLASSKFIEGGEDDLSGDCSFGLSPDPSNAYAIISFKEKCQQICGLRIFRNFPPVNKCSHHCPQSKTLAGHSRAAGDALLVSNSARRPSSERARSAGEVASLATLLVPPFKLKTDARSSSRLSALRRCRLRESWLRGLRC